MESIKAMESIKTIKSRRAGQETFMRGDKTSLVRKGLSKREVSRREGPSNDGIEIRSGIIIQIDFKKMDIKSVLKIVGSDECLGLQVSPLIALLHQIGKCNMLRPICLDEKVVSKMIKSFPVRFSGKHIGNACYGLQNLDPTQESTKALVSAIAEKVRNSPPSVELLSLIHI